MRAAIVLALLAGLVGMHQLPVAGMHDRAATALPAPASPGVATVAHPETSALHRDHSGDGDHGGLLHLCLAVLTALGLLAAAAALLGLVRHPVPALRNRTQVRIRPRGPPPPVPRRLAQLCVLRN